MACFLNFYIVSRGLKKLFVESCNLLQNLVLVFYASAIISKDKVHCFSLLLSFEQNEEGFDWFVSYTQKLHTQQASDLVSFC